MIKAKPYLKKNEIVRSYRKSRDKLTINDYIFPSDFEKEDY